MIEEISLDDIELTTEAKPKRLAREDPAFFEDDSDFRPFSKEDDYQE